MVIAQISLEPVFGWLVAVPLALVMLASLWLTLTSPGISLRQRWWLALLRMLATAVLLLGWLRPGFISETERESAGAIAVLMDRSQSMTLPSASTDKSRWEVQREVWQALLADTNLEIGQTKLVPYFYTNQAVPAPADDLPALESAFSAAPSGRVTDLGPALSDIVRLQVDPPLRGAILMGDAAQTAIPSVVDPTLIARQMGRLDQPIYMVGMGARDDRSLVKDAGIEGLPERYSAFVKKELNVRFAVSAQGMQNQPIQLQLKLRASGKPDQILDSREILPSQARQQLPQSLTIEVPEEGEYLLEASLQTDARDQVKSNDTALSFITVREGGAKILYLEGQPRKEQLFLKRSLNESLDFDVDYAWIQQRDRRKWPRNLTREISFDQYDALVIGDLDSSALDDNTQRAISQRVSQGAGLLLMGGYHSFDAGGYGRPGSKFRPMIPIEMPTGSQAFDAPIDTRRHIQDKVQLTPTRPHPITDMIPWDSLQPMDGMNRFGRPVAAPGVQVLLESQRREPALVTGEFGRGRVLAFAANSTWQWWLSGEKKAHQQFWRQALLWLIRRDTLNEGFRLDMDSRRLLIDETPDLQIEWFGGTENKPMPDTVRVELSRDGSPLRILSTAATADNMLQAKLTGLAQPGLYRAALTAEGADGEAYAAELAFVVRDESRELERLDADFQLMKSIVAANQAAGGRQVFPDEVDSLIRLLRERQEASKVTTIEKRRLGDGMWDSWLYLALFCGLLTTEWALRKAWQLP